jgi:hypothetical protein
MSTPLLELEGTWEEVAAHAPELAGRRVRLFVLAETPDDTSAVSLQAHSIDPVQAAELRASLATFAADWEAPEMDVYDDYDAAKSRI